MNQIFQQYTWVFNLCIVLVLGVSITIIELLLYNIYLPRAKKKQSHWRETLILALHRPLLYYVWSLVASIIFQMLVFHMQLGGDVLRDINIVRRVITLVFLFWFVMRFLSLWEKKYLYVLNNHQKKNRAIKDSTSINALAQVFRLLMIIAASLTLLSVVGIPISTLLAFGGIGGLAISFAAKDTLANLIGGLMIYWDRPFSVGDWVRSPDRQLEGTVIHIGWRLTCIRTFDKRPTYVPNGVFSNVVLENPSRMLNRRIRQTLGIRYDDADKVKTIVADITEMVKTHPDLDMRQLWFVNLVEFGHSSLNILVYVFTKTTKWIEFQAIKQDVLIRIIDIVAHHGAEFAFPTSTIHVPETLTLNQTNRGGQDGSTDLQ